MREVAFNTYENFNEIPAEQFPALFTTVRIGIKLEAEWTIKFLTDVTFEEDSNQVNLSWSDDPGDGLTLLSKTEVNQYAALLQDYAKSTGMTAKKAAKAIYLVPVQTGYRS